MPCMLLFAADRYFAHCHAPHGKPWPSRCVHQHALGRAQNAYPPHHEMVTFHCACFSSYICMYASESATICDSMSVTLRSSTSYQASSDLRWMCALYAPSPALPSCSILATRSYLDGTGLPSFPARRAFHASSRAVQGPKLCKCCDEFGRQAVHQRPPSSGNAAVQLTVAVTQQSIASRLHILGMFGKLQTPGGMGMTSRSSRFLTGKLTIVGFFSQKKLFLVKRLKCSTR